MVVPKEKERPVDAASSVSAAKPKRFAAEDITFSTESVFRGNEHVREILGGILSRGYGVLDVAEGAAREQAKAAFDDYIERLVQEDTEANRFLSAGHDVYGISWLGYILYLIGPAVGGRSVLPLRTPPRGVSDHSGKK